MSENFNIGGFEIESKSVYDTLLKRNLSDVQLKSVDIDDDNKISEDELAEFQGEGFETEDIESDDPTVKNLQFQREREESELYKNQKKLCKAQRKASKYQGELSGLDEESELYGKYQGKLSQVESEIDSLVSAISKNIQNLGNYDTQITDAIKDARERAEKAQAAAQAAAEQAAAQSVAEQAVTGVAAGAVSSSGVVSNQPVQTVSASNSTSALNAVSGSGGDLTKVTGDLSICLDRVGQSLGTSRQGAADYITTLCNKITGGKISPKIILSQIFSESSGKQSCSTTATSKYVGLGQMGASAVQAVNNKYGTNFSFNDMNNAAKNLEAMVYFMDLQFKRYDGNIGKALTAYNKGNCNDGVINGYARKIMARVA